jgi:hypothetical protein
MDQAILPPSSQRECHPEGLIQGPNACRPEAADVVRQDGLWEADEGVAVDAAFLPQALVDTDVDLRGEPVAPSVDRSANDRGEARVDQSLPADDDEDSRALGVACPRVPDAVEVCPLQMSA